MNAHLIAHVCGRVERILVLQSVALLTSGHGHAQAAAPEAPAVLGKYDTNQNGVLDADEVARKRSVGLRRSATTAFTCEEDIGATFVGEPRRYVWTNRLTF